MQKTIKLKLTAKCFIALVFVVLFLFDHVYSAEFKTITIIHPHDKCIHACYANDLAGESLDDLEKTHVSKALNDAIQKLFQSAMGSIYLSAGKHLSSIGAFEWEG